MSDPNAKEIDVHQADGALAELVTRAEYDVQIATAKRYPRSVKAFSDQAMEMVTLNEQIADDCIYALPRDGKTIEGPSARFAEIILHAWGHTRAAARVVNEDGRFITAQGVCHDLQSNTLIAYEVRRRITGKSGSRYSDDMIGVTGNAASSIALRNAVLKVIPKVFWEPIYQQARQIVMGDAQTLSNRRAAALAHLQKFGATEAMVLAKLGVKGVEDVTLEHLVTLRGIATALKEGDSTVEQMFAEPGKEASSKTDAIKDKLRAKNDPTPTVETAVAEQNRQAAASVIEKPELIQVESMPTASGTVMDWDGWATRWAEACKGMVSAADLELLRESNKLPLKNLEKANPPKHAWCLEQFTLRSVDFQGELLAS